MSVPGPLPPPNPPSVPGAPVTVDVAVPAELDRWRPFVQWVLAIPHLFIASLLGRASQAVAFVSWFIIVFTGRLPAGLANFQTMYLRYNLRATSYAAFLRDTYPPFAFEMAQSDPGDDPPVRLDVRPALEGRNRVTVFFRLILVIPHAIVLMVLGIAAVFAGLIAAFAVLFTRRWPTGLRDFVVGVVRWGNRVDAYMSLLHDEYPPFSLR